jgi:replication initiation and membrane attachment protein DnaB|tara:strand:+ start:139 stop:348 length:210 start_codon:yes stop_codon:yes gene_type:complete
MTPKDFAILIDQKVQMKQMTHMDAILEYCKEKEIEPDTITHLINRTLKEKIKLNAEELHYLPKSGTLPV